jgi:lysophospholipase L1-like esterase
MITKNIFSLATSIISLFIIILFSNNNSKSDENNIKYYSNDAGILSIMYHRFNENKYPSTNIQMDIFKKHIEIIRKSKYDFHNPDKIYEIFNKPKSKKEILLTIDDAFESFYEEAWPYLKKNKIPTMLIGMKAPSNLGKKYVNEFNAIYPTLSKKYNVIFFPFFLKDVALEPTLNQTDMIHPNKKGVVKIIENIFPYFLRFSKSLLN